MSALSLVILGLLMAVPPTSCQQGLGNLQPWMQGLIAVAVFLVLVAIAFAVNHFWCQEEPEMERPKEGGEVGRARAKQTQVHWSPEPWASSLVPQQSGQVCEPVLE
uniref:PDZK1-interacting protein 1 n=1 Tax=Catagonus wagneri TaxID=51154 RepID=A0A8C3YEY4_9CETA